MLEENAQFTDEQLTAIVQANKDAPFGPSPALYCALQAQLILDYRQNRALIVGKVGMGLNFTAIAKKVSEVITIIAPLLDSITSEVPAAAVADATGSGD
jgi:hypothetical protein